MATIRTNLSYRPSDDKNEVDYSEIMTQPDDTLSMREIYNRFRNGEPLDVNLYNPLYAEDEYQDIDVSVLDPVEVMELEAKYSEIRRKHEARLQAEKEREEFLSNFNILKEKQQPSE